MRRIRYARLGTERTNPRSRALDRMTPREIATLMNREDRRAVLAVARGAPEIAAAVGVVVASLRGGGRAGAVVVGVSAGGVTPFVVGALAESRKRGVATVLVACNAGPAGGERPAPTAGAPGQRRHVRISPATGPEVLAGSTRLKAG